MKIVTTNISGLQDSISPIFNSIGTVVQLKYYNIGFGAGSYTDDDQTLTQSGTTVYASGIIQQIGRKSMDAFVLEQGKILEDDSKLYLLGSVQTSGTIIVGIGSPATRNYSLIEPGTVGYKFGDSAVYKCLYLRWLPTGSLF